MQGLDLVDGLIQAMHAAPAADRTDDPSMLVLVEDKLVRGAALNTYSCSTMDRTWASCCGVSRSWLCSAWSRRRLLSRAATSRATYYRSPKWKNTYQRVNWTFLSPFREARDAAPCRDDRGARPQLAGAFAAHRCGTRARPASARAGSCPSLSSFNRNLWRPGVFVSCTSDNTTRLFRSS